VIYKEDSKIVLAEHGRSIADLKDDVQILERRLEALERRVSVLEENLAESMKLYSKLDISIISIDDKLSRLNSWVNNFRYNFGRKQIEKTKSSHCTFLGDEG
jgi:predicted  nucleic acid-binding Zn-ribbon protein